MMKSMDVNKSGTLILLIVEYCIITNILRQHLAMKIISIKIVNPKLRSVLMKLRISAHNLRVETGRYGRNRLERNERKCLICANSNDIATTSTRTTMKYRCRFRYVFVHKEMNDSSLPFRRLLQP